MISDLQRGMTKKSLLIQSFMLFLSRGQLSTDNNFKIATLSATSNSTLVEFKLASLNLQVGPQSGIIIVRNRPAGNIFRTKFFHSIFLLKFLNPTLDLKLDNFLAQNNIWILIFTLDQEFFCPKSFQDSPI